MLTISADNFFNFDFFGLLIFKKVGYFSLIFQVNLLKIQSFPTCFFDTVEYFNGGIRQVIDYQNFIIVVD